MKCHRAPSATLLACILLISGCGSEPDDRIFGTYVLVGVEGNPLPYLATSDADCDVYIAEGELTLNQAGTYALDFAGPYDCSRSGGRPASRSVASTQEPSLNRRVTCSFRRRFKAGRSSNSAVRPTRSRRG